MQTSPTTKLHARNSICIICICPPQFQLVNSPTTEHTLSNILDHHSLTLPIQALCLRNIICKPHYHTDLIINIIPLLFNFFMCCPLSRQKPSIYIYIYIITYIHASFVTLHYTDVRHSFLYLQMSFSILAYRH